MNYLKIFEDGTSEAVDVKPSWGMYEKEHALDNREVYIDGNWYSTTGGELVTNGTFDTDISGWVTVAGGAVPTWSSGLLSVVGNTANYPKVGQYFNTEVGVKYYFSLDYISGGNSPSVQIFDSTITEDLFTNLALTIGTTTGTFTATTESTILFIGNHNTSDNQTTLWDNISVYKTEPTIDTLQLPHTYLSNKGKLAGIEVANGIPVDIHYDELAPTLVEDTIKATDLVTNTLTLAETKWSNADGIEYFDDGLLGVPDTSFSSTGARLYPDGTIRGKSDYGDYIKSPDGEASASLVDATILGTGTQVFFPTTIFHASFSFSSAGGSFRHLQVLTSSNTSLTLLGFNSSGTAQNVTLISCDINGEWK